MKIRSWRWVVLVAAAISVLGASAAFAQKSPQPQAERNPAPGQVTPLAVDTFDGRVEPVDGTDDTWPTSCALPTSRPPTL